MKRDGQVPILVSPITQQGLCHGLQTRRMPKPRGHHGVLEAHDRIAAEL
jgi:hypothetical protein